MILVIGGSGFIGTILCRALIQKKIKFIILDKKLKEEFRDFTVIHDIKNSFNNIKIHNIQIIINLAAEHKDDVYPKNLYYETNTYGSKNICDFAFKNKIKHQIFISSVAVYGISNEIISITNKLDPLTEYGKSKLLAEEIYCDWYKKDVNNKLLIVRPTAVFGEGNRGNIYKLFKLIANNKFIMIGNGNNVKSIAYVENLVEFLIHVIDLDKIHIFNYVDEPNMNMNELVHTIRKIMNIENRFLFKIPFSVAYILAILFNIFSIVFKKIDIGINTKRLSKFCSNSIFLNNHENLDFKPKYTLRDALIKTIFSEFSK